MKPKLFALLLLTATISRAQSPEAALDSAYQNDIQEKVVVTLNQRQYIAGETIFFKSYTLNGYRLSSASTNLYTELYSADRQVIQSAMVPLFGGAGNGSFVLPPTLLEGVYYLRAYTTHTLQHDPRFEFIQPITVYNPVTLKRLQTRKPEWTVMAKPESGAMLNGSLARVAVRLLSATVLPAGWQAGLYEKESGALVAPVEVLNSEVGTVIFMPEAGKQYLIKATDNTGLTKESATLTGLEQGTALMVSVAANRIAYSIKTKGLAANGAGYQLVGSVNDQAVFSATIKSAAGDITGFVPTAGIDYGVLRFTLFDEKGIPQNERLCFVHQAPTQTLKLSTDTASVEAKGYNSWQLQTDSALAVHQIQVLESGADKQADFLAQVYLTADFTNRIHNAEWYLSTTDAERRAALDALLITETQARYSWSEVLNKPPANHRAFFPAYLNYSATVYKAGKPQRLRAVNLVLQQVSDSAIKVLSTTTDSTGRFYIHEALFADSMRVFFQANDRKFLEKDIKVEFVSQNRFAPLRGELPLSAYELVNRTATDTVPSFVKRATVNRTNELLLRQQSDMLEEVIVKTRAKNATAELDKKYSSPLFGGSNPSTIFDFVNNPQQGAYGYANILQWLRGRVAGLNVVNRNGVTQVYLRGNTSLLGASTVQIYVDDMPVDAEFLNGYPVANIAMIKVIKGPSLAGGGNGAIVIYSKRGGEGGPNLTTGMASGYVLGYKTQPRYPQPDYSIAQMRKVADVRQTLFYGTAEEDNGGYRLRFYNNDTAKAFRVIVSGFDNAGKPVYLEKVVEQGRPM